MELLPRWGPAQFLKPPRELALTADRTQWPQVRLTEGAFEDAFLSGAYSRGAPSPLVRKLGSNPHIVARPLRAALLALMLEQRVAGHAAARAAAAAAVDSASPAHSAGSGSGDARPALAPASALQRCLAAGSRRFEVWETFPVWDRDAEAAVWSREAVLLNLNVPASAALSSVAGSSSSSLGDPVSAVPAPEVEMDSSAAPGSMRALLMGHPLHALEALFPLEAACLLGAAVAARAAKLRSATAAAASHSHGPTAGNASEPARAAADRGALSSELPCEDPTALAEAAASIAGSAAASAAASTTAMMRSGHSGATLGSPARAGDCAVELPMGHLSPKSEFGGAVLQPPPAAMGRSADAWVSDIARQNWHKHVFGCASVVAEMCAAATGGSFLQAMIALGF